MDNYPIQDTANNILLLLEDFLISLKISSNSKNTYRKNIFRFIEWTYLTNTKFPLGKDLIKYLDFLKKEKVSTNTIYIYFTSLKRFICWLNIKGYYPNIFSNNIDYNCEIEPSKTLSLSKEQVETILNKQPKTTLLEKRNYAILNLMFRTGLRPIDIVNLNINDIKKFNKDKLLWLKSGIYKNNPNFIFLTEKAFLPIKNYLNNIKIIKGSNPLFSSKKNPDKRLCTKTISRILAKAFAIIGIKKINYTNCIKNTFTKLYLFATGCEKNNKNMKLFKNIKKIPFYNPSVKKDNPEFIIDKLIQ